MPRSPAGTELRFLADAMLERLARWLRVLGVDTASAGAHADRELVRLAVEERRVVLTRDRLLPEHWPLGEYLLIRSAVPLEQLREVVDRYHLAPPRELFTRCLVCNAELRAASAEEVARQVPPASRGGFGEFRSCPRCGRVYWEGSHARRMRRTLGSVFEHRAGGAGDTGRPAGA